jgi:hypothetical protein
MAPKGSSKGKGKPRAKMPTSVINQSLGLDRHCIQGFISDHPSGLIQIYNGCCVKDERAWTSFVILSFLIQSRLASFNKSS